MSIRPIKELLKIVLDNPQHFELGLCYWVNNLFIAKIITRDEEESLKRYIKKYPTFIFLTTNTCFYWPASEIEPRIEFLNHHIESL